MGGTHAGGSVAGPVFRRIGEMALRYLGVTPRGSVPMKLSEISERARDGDVAATTYQVLGEARAPEPSGGAMTASAPMKSGEARVPDFTGLPQREVVKAAIGIGLVPAIEGTGRLSRQDAARRHRAPEGVHREAGLRALHMKAPESRPSAPPPLAAARAGARDPRRRRSATTPPPAAG